MSTYYLIAVEGGIEPSLHGPYDTIEERNEDAQEIAKDQDPGSDGLFPLIRKTTAIFRSARTREGSWLVRLSLNNAVHQSGCLCIAQSHQLPDYAHSLPDSARWHPS